MRTLFLDLASREGCIACIDADAVVARQTIDHRVRDHELLPLLEQLLASAGWTFDSLERIACVVGPGGFTSLRVGVTCANTLADQLAVPIAGLHLSEVYGGRMEKCGSAEMEKRRNGEVDDVLWLHSTKRSELFVRGYGAYAARWPEAVHVRLDDLIDHIGRDVPAARLYVGELIPEHQEAMAACGLQEADRCSLEEVLPGLLADATYGSSPVLPWYGREG